MHCGLKCSDGRVTLVLKPEAAAITQLSGAPASPRDLVDGDRLEVAGNVLTVHIDDRDPLIGTVLGGYRVEARLGRGAMGTVYRAKQLSLDRTVALKLLAQKFVREPGFVEQFLKEARAVAKLGHPKVVQVHDAGEVDRQFFFAMEFLPGGTVADLLKADGRIALSRALSIGADAADALAWAEENGIVHRDVKPGNLLIAEDGAVKLGDLGIALDLSSSQAKQSKRKVGSPRYMAPEQALGETVDQRADIYGLGSTLFHMIAGKPPFVESDNTAILKAKIQSEAPRLSTFDPSLPTAVVDLVATMLARDPKKRFASCRDVVDAIDQIRSGPRRPVRASAGAPDGGRARAGDRAAKSRRRSLEIASIGVSVVLVIATAFWAFSGGGGGTPPERPAPNVVAPGGTADETDGSDDAVRAPERRMPLRPVASDRNERSGSESSGIPDELAARNARRRAGNTDGGSTEASRVAVHRKLGDIARDWRDGILSNDAALRDLHAFRRAQPTYAEKIDRVVAEVEAVRKEAVAKQLAEELRKVDAAVKAGEFRRAETMLSGLRATHGSADDLVEAEKQFAASVAKIIALARKRALAAAQAGDYSRAAGHLRPLLAALPDGEAPQLQTTISEMDAAEKVFRRDAADFLALEYDVWRSVATGDLERALANVKELTPVGSSDMKEILRARRKQIEDDVGRAKRAWNGIVKKLTAQVGETLALRFAGDDKKVTFTVSEFQGGELTGRRLGRSVEETIPALDLAPDLLRSIAGSDDSIAESTGILLLYGRGPYRAEAILGDPDLLPAARHAFWRDRLVSARSDYLEGRVTALTKVRDSLTANGEIEGGASWKSVLSEAKRLITGFRATGEYVAKRRTLAAVYLDAAVALQKEFAPENLFSAKVKERRGLIVLSYAFKKAEELADFVPIGPQENKARIGRRGLTLTGEYRLLRGNPFREKLSVTSVVSKGGYDPRAPNINVALWTHDEDAVSTEPGVYFGTTDRVIEDDDKNANDYVVFGIGYHVPNRGFLHIRGLSTVAPYPANALLGGERGNPLHGDSPSECVWATGVIAKTKGSQICQIKMDRKTLSWKVNRKTIPVSRSDDFGRFARAEPYTGSVSLFTNGQTVTYTSLEVEGELDPDWIDQELRRRAEKTLLQFEPNYPFVRPKPRRPPRISRPRSRPGR